MSNENILNSLPQSTILKNLLNQLGTFFRVNHVFSKNNKVVPEQFTIIFENGILFQYKSQNSVLKLFIDGEEQIYLFPISGYDRKATIARNRFLGLRSNDVRKKIRKREIIEL